MAILNQQSFSAALIACPFILLAYYLILYVFTFGSLRPIPGPFLARFTNLQNMYKSRASTRTMWIYDSHKKYGTVVRIAPNHISIAHEEAINVILGHGNGLLKSSFYDAFVTTDRSIFTTRDRASHSRKRRIVSHTFSPKSVLTLEPHLMHHIAIFVEKLEEIAERRAGASGFAEIDCMRWHMFLTFDALGEVVFSKSFGMLQKGSDIVEAKMNAHTDSMFLPAIENLKARGKAALTLGALPELLPFARYIPDPFFRRGFMGVKNIAGMAIARIKERLDDPSKHDVRDILAILMQPNSEGREQFGFRELIAEAATLFIAGTDTTGITLGATMIHLARAPHALRKLQAELDSAVPNNVAIPSFDMIRNLPYLNAVINETQRHHSTIGIGLPREIPPDSPGIHFQGHYFPTGTVLSVPGFTVHHLEEIWGPDAMEYKPERWQSLTPRQRAAFFPFSHGPTACLGRSFADIELKLTVAAWARRLDVYMSPDDEVRFSEGLTKRPVSAMVKIRRRGG
ncbi:hypothetical protein NLU13_7332 [Sarocladium strictum]|uniref:Cytochrome P450 n=1 Tax=Sarocladium strictum TaxID=5046 RepID=A0AA39GDB1_SARSR|nr:hypothetical protein NLU13_7332 [Sarocladium strictum]